MTDPQQLLTPDEIVDWLHDRGVTMAAVTVRRAIKAGQLPGRIVGNRYLSSVAALQNWFYRPPIAQASEEVEVPRPMVIPFVGRRSA